MVNCPSCDRDDFKTERGMKQHHTMVHDECLTEETRTCEWCGSNVTIRQPSRKQSDKTFCHDDCRGKYLSQSMRGEDNPNWDANSGYVKPEVFDEVECSGCEKTLPLDEEHFFRCADRFVISKCKKCWHGVEYGYGNHRDPWTKETEDGKYECARCEELKPRDEDHFYPSNSRDFSCYCIECDIEIAKERQSKVRSAGKPLTSEEWRKIKDFYGTVCAYCGKNPNFRLTKDHIVPINSGGSNAVSNIVPACQSCNSSKGSKNVKDWFPEQEFYEPERMQRILNTPLILYND